MPTAADVLAALPQLPADDLLQIEQRCKALRSLGGGSLRLVSAPGVAELADCPGSDTDADLVLHAVAAQLRRSGAEFASVPVLRRSTNGLFRTKAGEVMEFIRHGGVTRRVEQAAVIAIAVELLYDNMTQMGIMVSARTLLAHVHRLPAALNRALITPPLAFSLV